MRLLERLLSLVLNPRSRLGRIRNSSVSTAAGDGSAPLVRRGRLRARDVLLNLPLVAGSIAVLALFLLILFGPVWAPENPYVSAQHIVPHYDPRSGTSIQPPLPPSAEYPLGTDRWGNDLLSMLMHGSRNTLVACSFVTMIRVILGLILGGVTGWNEGRPIDQLVMGAVGVITSVPTLISSIILIYALDIRKGLPVFILALSAIGWTEIAQYIRSEFLLLRKMPYIEGAHAVGMNALAVAVRHVLPNVLPQLLVISFLEMGAVMMLLGELGFVGVYIGGGSRISVETDPFVFEMRTLIEVPEWGAMLADGYRWLRARPFVIMPPAVAFFLSVLSFNALGEGLRRLIEKSSLNTAFLLRKPVLLAVGALAVATVFIMNNTGPAPWFAKVAAAFDGDEAYRHVEALADMEGRGVGQPGGIEAAAYIAERFAEYGLEPGWQRQTYEFPLAVRFVRPVEQPVLALVDPNGEPLQAFRHQVDFGFLIEGHGGSGDVTAPLTFVGFQARSDAYSWESFKGLDLRGRVVMLLEGNAPDDFAVEAMIRGARGVLWIAGEQDEQVHSQFRVLDQTYLRSPQLPVFRIPGRAAMALLEAQNVPLFELREGAAADQSGPGWFTRDLDLVVRLSLELGEPADEIVPCVLGYLPGSDYDLAGELVVVMAYYDGLGVDPDGTVYAAANHAASGVGVLLEIARLWHEQELDARRSVLFVAWGGGSLNGSSAEAFLRDTTNFRHLPGAVRNRPSLLFQLDGLGAGGDNLFVHPLSDPRLTALVQETCAEAGISVVSGSTTVPRYDNLVTRGLSWIYLGWEESGVEPDQDALEWIHPQKLQNVGQALALVLTRIVRQTTY